MTRATKQNDGVDSGSADAVESSKKPSPMPKSRGIKAKRKALRQQRALRDTVLPKVRCSVEESERIRQLAESADMTLSAYIRTSALKKRRIVVKRQKAIADDALIREINRIGVNLNQIARAVNSGASGLPDDWCVVRDKCEHVLDRLLGLSYGGDGDVNADVEGAVS